MIFLAHIFILEVLFLASIRLDLANNHDLGSNNSENRIPSTKKTTEMTFNANLSRSLTETPSVTDVFARMRTPQGGSMQKARETPRAPRTPTELGIEFPTPVRAANEPEPQPG